MMNNNNNNNNNDRIEFYLGNFTRDKKTLPQMKNMEYYYDENKMSDKLNKIYLDPFYQLLKRCFPENEIPEKQFLLEQGDIQSFFDDCVFSFVKNRPRDHPEDGVLLLSLNFERHWGQYYRQPKDMKYEDKKDVLIWRGATTGCNSQKGNRFQLVEQWFEKTPTIDVGFSLICQNRKNYGSFFNRAGIINKYKKKIMSPSAMNQYKFILSVNGNDKDSGLNWKLISNSVVFMTKPRIVSWLMESKLQPNIHYVEIKDDFSNLEEKVQYGIDHPEEMKKIANNAKNYMKQFSSLANENHIEKKVVERYFAQNGDSDLF